MRECGSCASTHSPLSLKHMGKKKTKEKEKKEKERSLVEAVRGLPQKKKTALAVILAVIVTGLIFAFTFTFINAVTPEKITEEDYLKLLSKLDGRTWAIKKGDEEALASSLYSFEPDGARTKKSGGTLLLILYDDREEYTLHFTYRDDRIRGFIGSDLYSLYHSTGKKETGRALSLVSRENKITLYEE